MMEEDTFICAVCGRTFIKGRSDEGVLTEKHELFPNEKVEDCVVVCDDCFIAMDSGRLTPQRITDTQRDGRRILVWAKGAWWPASWRTTGDYGPGWYPGVFDSSEGYLGFPDDEVIWWLPMPPNPMEE